MPLIFPYQERAHPLFGVVQRPLMRLALRSERFGRWIALDDVLADTGADLSVVSLPVGRLLFTDVEQGEPIQLGGVISSAQMFGAFVHGVQVRLGESEWEMPLAVVVSEAVPPIFGRQAALDRFVARFVSGEELILDA